MLTALVSFFPFFHFFICGSASLVKVLFDFFAEQTVVLPASVGSLAWAGSGSGVVACGLEDGSIHLLRVCCFAQSFILPDKMSRETDSQLQHTLSAAAPASDASWLAVHSFSVTSRLFRRIFARCLLFFLRKSTGFQFRNFFFLSSLRPSAGARFKRFVLIFSHHR